MEKKKYLDLKKKLDFKPSNAASLIIVLLNLSLFFFGIYLLKQKEMYYTFMAWVIFGFQFNQSYLIMHETGHNSFFSSTRINKIVGYVMSIFAFLPYRLRQYEHNVHHQWAGTFKDATYKRAIKTFGGKGFDPITMKILNFCWKLWIPILALNEHILLWKIALFNKERRAPSIAKKNMISAIFILVSIIFFIFVSENGLRNFLLMLPGFYIFLVLIEFINMPHHFDSPINEDYEITKCFWNQDYYSKSMEPIPFISSILFLNFNYHIVHHFYPSLPWSKLPKAHKLLETYDKNSAKMESEIMWHIKLRSNHDINIILDPLIEFSRNMLKKQPSLLNENVLNNK